MGGAESRIGCINPALASPNQTVYTSCSNTALPAGQNLSALPVLGAWPMERGVWSWTVKVGPKWKGPKSGCLFIGVADETVDLSVPANSGVNTEKVWALLGSGFGKSSKVEGPQERPQKQSKSKGLGTAPERSFHGSGQTDVAKAGVKALAAGDTVTVTLDLDAGNIFFLIQCQGFSRHASGGGYHNPVSQVMFQLPDRHLQKGRRMRALFSTSSADVDDLQLLHVVVPNGDTVVAGEVDVSAMWGRGLHASGVEEQRLLASFDFFDKDKNGYLDKKELARRLAQGSRSPLSQAEIDNFFSRIDTDSSGEITRGEFIAFYQQ